MTPTEDIHRKALRSLNDCAVIRASSNHPGFKGLVERRLAYATPSIGGTRLLEYRSTLTGKRMAGRYRRHV